MDAVKFFSDLSTREQAQALIDEMLKAQAGLHRGYNTDPNMMLGKWISWVCDIADM